MWVATLCFFLVASGVLSKPVDDEPTCGYDACPLSDPATLNVHVVPHSHDDVGWLKTFDQYYFQDVQNVISSVIVALKLNPERRFVQVETAFFKKWWDQQKDSVRQDVINLVNNGQFEIINGAWSMNDEAAVNYQYTIDQYTLGLRYLEDRLGKCSRPRVGWQIDPFGHSREQASISAQLGFDSLYFARLDYRDKINRLSKKSGDLLWRGSSSLGNAADIFTSVLYNHYSAPPGFCFDIVCDDDPIIDDPESPDYNYQNRVETFANFVREQASKYPTNNIIVVMGDDFRYQAALNSYINTDRLIAGFDLFPQTFQGKTIKVFYSTPSCYAKAVNDYAITNDYNLEIKTDDFFPYADGVGNLVVGYFTSRPASKRFVRDGNILLQTAKQLAAAVNVPYDNVEINSLKEAMGVLQHHDAITGTELIDVTHDYHRLLHKGISDTSDAVDPILSNLITGSGDNDLQFKSCLLANVSYCPETKSDQFTLVVYNPLSRVVSSPISVPVDTETWSIVDPEGQEVIYQVEPTVIDFSEIIPEAVSPFFLEFVATDLPPFGYKVYTFAKTESAKIKSVTVGNEDTSFEVDETTGLLTSVTMNGVTLDISQDFLYYTSGGGSQAYVFTPASNDPQTIASTVTTSVVEGDIYSAVVQEFSDWAHQTIKVYKHDSSHIEFDYIIGPLDINDGGKEVISRFTTSLNTEGAFYTDSNGRETLKRVRNYRPDYEYTDEQPVSGNYYPITSKLAIKDEDSGLEVAVLNDRSQGGSSIEDGQLELMVHRAISTSDAFGLDEQEYDHGIVIRGKHYLVVGPSSGNGEKSLAAIERDVVQRKFLQPWVFVTNQDVSDQLVNLQFSNLKTSLPDNVQLLTLEPWKDNTILLRLEHVLEKDDDPNLSVDVTVDLSDLFVAFTISELAETTLAGNIPIDEYEPLHWPGSTNDTPKVRRDVGADLQVTLSPMQIRTFLATVTYN